MHFGSARNSAPAFSLPHQNDRRGTRRIRARFGRTPTLRSVLPRLPPIGTSKHAVTASHRTRCEDPPFGDAQDAPAPESAAHSTFTPRLSDSFAVPRRAAYTPIERLCSRAWRPPSLFCNYADYNIRWSLNTCGTAPKGGSRTATAEFLNRSQPCCEPTRVSGPISGIVPRASGATGPALVPAGVCCHVARLAQAMPEPVPLTSLLPGGAAP